MFPHQLISIGLCILFPIPLLGSVIRGSLIPAKAPTERFPDFGSSASEIDRHFRRSTLSARDVPNPNNVPDTGKVRPYEFTVTRSEVAPDGVKRHALLVNNQFPGPTIEADWGDVFEITVHNNITGPSEGTAIHWHGLLHKGAPWYDGVPSVDICPIAPGETFKYVFRADSYGTSWWHSHYSAQLVDGVWGPMIIRGPTSKPYDVDLGPVALTSNYHVSYDENMRAQFEVPSQVIIINSNLINGKMFYDCNQVADGNCKANAPISTFEFQPNKTHLLRLINSGGEGTQIFSIDNHVLTVISSDYTPINPYETEFITLGQGQRADVIVAGTGSSNQSYYMRASISACDPAFNPHAVAAIYYPGADKTKLPTSQTRPNPSSDPCKNEALSKTVPAFPIKPPAQPAVTQEFNIEVGTNATGHKLLYINKVSFRANYNYPVLLLANAGNTSYPEDPEWNVYNFGSNSSVRLIFYNNVPLYHPMHLHGHNFWVLAEGNGVWDGTVVNPDNPIRRDTQLLLPGTPDNPGYLVLEFETDNPGVWPLHCHIAWHSAGGMYLNIIEHPEKLKLMNPPETVVDTCRGWWNYTGHEVVNQIDSGV